MSLKRFNAMDKNCLLLKVYPGMYTEYFNTDTAVAGVFSLAAQFYF